MTQAFNRDSFLFRGNAVGTGGTNFSVLADSCLPTIGGIAKNVAENYYHRGLDLTFERVATSAQGRFDAGRKEYVTQVEASVAFYTLGKVFHLDEGFIRLISRHNGDADLTMPIDIELPKELEFSFAGYKARATFSADLLELNTRQSLLKALSDKGFASRYGERFYHSANVAGACTTPLSEGVASAPAGYLIYSPVEELEWEGVGRAGNRVDGHVLTSADVGRCFVAESYRDNNSLRSNLLRLHLTGREEERRVLFKTGAKADAESQKATNTEEKRGQGDDDVIIAGVETNGIIIPP